MLHNQYLSCQYIGYYARIAHKADTDEWVKSVYVIMECISCFGIIIDCTDWIPICITDSRTFNQYITIEVSICGLQC